MKILLILLLPLTCFSQCPEDLWKRAVLMTDKPMEVVIGKGQNMVLIVFQRKDTTKAEKWTVTPEGTVAPVPVTLKETINDISSRITYTGVWTKGSNQPWTANFLNKDVSYTYQPNASASLAFAGSRIEVVSERRSNHAVAKIEVKQGATVIDSQLVDTFTASDANGPSTIYSKDVPKGAYVITVTLSAVSAGRDSFVLDSFKIYE